MSLMFHHRLNIVSVWCPLDNVDALLTSYRRLPWHCVPSYDIEVRHDWMGPMMLVGIDGGIDGV